MQNNLTTKAAAMDQFRAALKKHSLKATPQRIAVHEAMLRLGHASADMVAEDLQTNSNAKVTVATVYNILTSLAMLGIYHHRMSANSKMYFDVNTFRHIHLYDAEAHTFRDVLDDELMEMIHSRLRRKKFRGYKVENIDIQIIARPTSRRAVK